MGRRLQPSVPSLRLTMPHTVAGGFSALLEDLGLTPRQEEVAEGRVGHLESYFDKYIVCAKLPFKIGSYERGTVIRWRRDIDVMVALHYPTYKDRYDDDSAAMLRWLRERLNIEYGDTIVTRQQVAIRMALGDGLQVDLVPTFPRSGGGFLMPDGSGGWRATNPPHHATEMSRANVALDLKLKPLVRVMKAWNEANSHHLQSFHLEMMVWEMWHNDKALPALPQAVSDTLRKGVTWMKYPMNDPWTDAGTRAIDTYLSADERGVVTRLFEADHSRAEQALAFDRAGQTAKAFERWGVVFTGRFPSYG